MAHPVGPVEDAVPINQEGPPEIRLASVVLGTLPILERHHCDTQVQPLDLVLVLSQLRQMLAAGKSGEVPVEDHQQPVAPILLETMNGTGGVLQCKPDRRRPYVAAHPVLRNHRMARRHDRAVPRPLCSVFEYDAIAGDAVAARRPASRSMRRRV